MDDLISRQAAINALEYLTDFVKDNNYEDGETLLFQESAIEQINALPSAQPEWVSVTERLPEEKINPYTHDFEPIICSTNFGDVRVYKYGTPIGWDEPHFWNGAGIMDWYITHWMPLPEAPKDGE